MRVALGIGIAIVAGAVVLLGVTPAPRTAGAPVAKVEPYALYDDFNGPTLNPDKWFGTESFARGTLARRFQANGLVRMHYTGWASTTSDTGAVGSTLQLAFINPSVVTAMKASVRVPSSLAPPYGLVACPSNTTTSTRIRARLFGAFFNAGTPTPGSDLDNVYAYIRLARDVNTMDPINTFRVEAQAFRCTDSTCTTASTLPFQTLATGIPLATWATMSVQWDEPNNQFIFQYGANAPVSTAYVWSDAAAPSFLQKRLHVQDVVPNCTSVPRPVAWMTVHWDDVFVNQSAATAIGRRVTVPSTPSPAYDR